MTRPGPGPNRGMMARLQQAMAPALIEDDGKPISRPIIVEVATGLAWLAAAVFFFLGGTWLVTAHSQVDAAVRDFSQNWDKAIIQCQTQLGNYGTAVPSTLATPTPTPATSDVIKNQADLVPTCQQLTTPHLDENAFVERGLSSIRTAAVIMLVFGVMTAVGGWLIRAGNKWGRRLLIGVVALSLAVAGLNVVSNVVFLVGVFIVVASLLCAYVGKGGTYFARVALRQARRS